MNDLQKFVTAILVALGLGASGGAAISHNLAPAKAPAAAVNSACPNRNGWHQTGGSDPHFGAVDARGNGISQFVVCERPNGDQVTIFANGTYSGTTADGHAITNPKAVLDADR